MNVLIDSSGWIEYFSNGGKSVFFEKAIIKTPKQKLVVPSIVVYEVYKKIKKDAGEEKAKQAIAHIVNASTIIHIDSIIALEAAEISLKEGLAMADALIKASAEINNAILLTTDNHFKGMENTEVY